MQILKGGQGREVQDIEADGSALATGLAILGALLVWLVIWAVWR